MAEASGRSRPRGASMAIGENRTSRGADLPLYFWRQRVLDERVEVLLERLQPLLAGERLVIAEEGEDDVGLRPGQPLVGRAEVGRAEPEGQFIAGEAEVADDELVLGKPSLEVRSRASRRAASGRPGCCR